MDDKKFLAHLRNDYGRELVGVIEPDDRGRCVLQVLELWSRLGQLTEVDQRRHVLAPAVESSEAWCVAAFDNKHESPESLRGQDLVRAFMAALEVSEGRPLQAYAEANKDVGRREKFCEKHAASGYARIMARCPHFERAVTQLRLVAG